MIFQLACGAEANQRCILKDSRAALPSLPPFSPVSLRSDDCGQGQSSEFSEQNGWLVSLLYQNMYWPEEGAVSQGKALGSPPRNA